MDIEALAKFNPWWSNGAVPPQLLGARERPALIEAKRQLGRRLMVLLYGLRRTGKTTILYQVIDSLLKSGIKPESILYFSFDEKPASIDGLISAYEEKVLKKRLDSAGKIFIFLDEVQKADCWQEKAKILYDLNPGLKMFLSGSASISLQRKSAESLAGRLMTIHVKPLSFSEFAEWKGVKLDTARPEVSQRDAMPLLADYLRKGGFPEIVEEESDDDVRSYIRNTVLERVVSQDLPGEFGLKDIGLLKTLLEMFCRDPGMIVNVDGISRDLGRNKITIGNYIEHLKYALLVSEVKNLRSRVLSSSRKNKKVYPSSTAFCFAYREDFFSDSAMERVAEAAVAIHISAQHYYLNSFEVDFVQKSGAMLLPIEVKYGPRDEGQLRKFMEKFGAGKGVLVTKGIFSPEKAGIRAVPLWLFLNGPESGMPPELSKEAFESIKSARKRIKAGNFVTEADAKKRLGPK